MLYVARGSRIDNRNISPKNGIIKVGNQGGYHYEA